MAGRLCVPPHQRSARRLACCSACCKGRACITRAFAARGLGVVKEPRGVGPLVATLGNETEVTNVRVEAARALAELSALDAADVLIKVVADPRNDQNLRLEAVTALGQLGARPASDLLIDLMTEPWPSMRAAALTALARVDADSFMLAMSGLDVDPHWSVRAAMATALGTLDVDRAQSRLTQMLNDEDQRVIPAVLTALVAVGSPNAEARARRSARGRRSGRAAGGGQWSGTTEIAESRARRLLAAYERGRKDPTYVARAGDSGGGRRARSRGRAAAARSRAAVDRDWAIRVRAAALLETHRARRRMCPGCGRRRPSGLAELNELDGDDQPDGVANGVHRHEKGLIQIELAVLDAPRAVANFISLARRNFLGGTPFHRVVPNFVAQDGDPRGDGEGGPGYTIRDEINQRPYLRGTVGMALDWEDTGGSQFFITHAPQPHLDGRYTVFGRVVQGMDVVDRLQQWDQIRTVRVWDGVNWIGQLRSGSGAECECLGVRAKKKGGDKRPFDLLNAAELPLLRLLGLLGRLLCFLRHWSNPPLQVGLLRKVYAAPPRRLCRLALSTRVPTPSRFVARPMVLARDVLPFGFGSGHK